MLPLLARTSCRSSGNLLIKSANLDGEISGVLIAAPRHLGVHLTAPHYRRHTSMLADKTPDATLTLPATSVALVVMLWAP